MKENIKRDEPLSEELLEQVTGAAGSFASCRECGNTMNQYIRTIRTRNDNQSKAFEAVVEGNNRGAAVYSQEYNNNHLLAQQKYQQMAAHGHPDLDEHLRRRGLPPPAGAQ